MADTQLTTDLGQRSAEHKKLCRISQGSRPVFGPSVTFSPRVTVINSEIKNSIVSTPAPMPQQQQQQAPAIVARGVGNYLPPDMPRRRRLETLDSDPYYSSSGSDEGYHGGYSAVGVAAAAPQSTDEILGLKVCLSGAGDFPDDKCTCDKIESISGSPPQSSSSLSSHSSHINNAEFSNKLTLQDSGYSTNSLPFVGDSSSSSSSIIDQDQYNTLLDFSLKLGYSEQQLKVVLFRLSSNTINGTNGFCLPPVEQIFGQDKILSELIKLGQEINDNNEGGSCAILNEKSSCTCSLGTENSTENKGNQGALRAIVIDGSNVAMTHGHKEIFSCKGIKECVDWFKERGHADIKVFVPQFRKEASRSDAPITDQHILFDLEQEGILIWTPSRRLGGGRRIVCHDDKYIVKTAHDKEAVIVSNDEYRDIVKENAEFKKIVEDRLLMYSFVDGKFMPPDDPLGRYGPKLEQFLRKGPTNAIATLCPYGRKCTYGNKCKFSHPERPNGLHKSVTERLKDHADLHRRISPSNSLQPQKSDVAIILANNGAKNCNNSPKASFSCPQHHSPASRSQSLNFTHQNRFATVKNGSNFPAAAKFPIFSSDGYCTTFPNQLRRQQQILAHESLAKQFSDPSYVTTTTPSSFLRSSLVAASDNVGGFATPPPAPVTDENFVLPPGLRQIWQHHAPVGRNFSAPGVPQQHRYGNAPNGPTPNFFPSSSTFNFQTVDGAAAQSPLANEKTRKNSVSDTRLNAVVGPSTAVSAGTDWLFLTSSNVWAPLTTTTTNQDGDVLATKKEENWPSLFGDSVFDERRDFWEKRRQLFYHLSKLFPDVVVDRVMASNPDERDAQRLCQLILAENAKN